MNEEIKKNLLLFEILLFAFSKIEKNTIYSLKYLENILSYQCHLMLQSITLTDFFFC